MSTSSIELRKQKKQQMIMRIVKINNFLSIVNSISCIVNIVLDSVLFIVLVLLLTGDIRINVIRNLRYLFLTNFET